MPSGRWNRALRGARVLEVEGERRYGPRRRGIEQGVAGEDDGASPREIAQAGVVGGVGKRRGAGGPMGLGAGTTGARSGACVTGGMGNVSRLCWGDSRGRMFLARGERTPSKRSEILRSVPSVHNCTIPLVRHPHPSPLPEGEGAGYGVSGSRRSVVGRTSSRSISAVSWGHFDSYFLRKASLTRAMISGSSMWTARTGIARWSTCSRPRC